MTFAYGCCVGSWDKFQSYVTPNAHGPVFATSGHSSIALAYNAIIECMQWFEDCEGLILVHDDLEIADDFAEDKFRDVLRDPSVALVGVAGGGDALISSIAWWEHSPIGHQQTDVSVIDFGKREGDVGYLEGSIMVLAPWTLKTLRFDPRFTSFHGYEEICVQAANSGRRVAVADVDTQHHTHMGFKTPESAKEWARANEVFQRKWGR